MAVMEPKFTNNRHKMAVINELAVSLIDQLVLLID